MKSVLMILLFFTHSAFAQFLWERNDKHVCVQTKINVDDVRLNLRNKTGRECDYHRDATRIVLGNFFKCVDGKTYAYFRTKVACELFFKEGKKELVKFAPTSSKDPKNWIKNFGECMEKATPGQYSKMGPQMLNSFCYCVAEKSKDKITGFVVDECSKSLK